MAAAALAARTYGVALPRLLDCGGRKARAGGDMVKARPAALYLAAVGGNLSGSALERATGMAGPTIRHHLRKVEDSRELKADLDAMLDEMTVRLRGALGTAFADVAA